MKKSIWVLCASFLLLAGIEANAQVGVAVGIKAGPNFAKINADESANQNYKNRTGFHGGAFVLIKASKIGVQPEILFSQQGSKLEINTEDYEANFNYINIPIMVKLYTVAGINLQVGPQFGFLSLAEVKSTGANASTDDIKDQCKKSDMSAAFGLGWDLPFGLTIDARYNLGLSKIFDDASNNSNAKNQVIQLSVGYKLFKLGK